MAIELDKVTAATFEPAVGSSFEARLGDQVREVILEEVKWSATTSPGGRESCSLTFRFKSSDRPSSGNL